MQIPEEQRKKPIKSINYAFKTYFKIHRDVQLQDLDGSGPLTATRTIIMSPELLMEQINIQKSDSTMVYDYINRLAYLQVAFFGDLTTEWNI